ncbi:hypothetical protein HDU91_001551, partial [Kappamyces sp. JEL0680]
MATRNILVCVVGTTGVGKSALAIKIAQALHGVCINGDSMQVYQGLDTVTNKPSKDELALCPHFLFDFVEPTMEYSVAEFTRDASQCVAAQHSRQTTPVLVGGTNYYIQSLLWDKSIIASASTPGLANKLEIAGSAHPSLEPLLASRLSRILEATDPRYKSAQEIQDFCTSGSDLFDMLAAVDPIMARRWHPKDYRKLRRSLEIYYTTGMTQSAWYAKQKREADSVLRWPTVMIWLYGRPDILDPRLDARVDDMLAKGMINEMLDMRAKVVGGQVVGTESAYTRGVLQAIGFKEFHDYFLALEAGDGSDKTDGLFQEGVEKMKLATRQYARQQVHWIRNKLAPAILQEHDSGNAAFY